MAIRPEKARQGEITPRHRQAKVLVISTVLAFVALALVAYIMGWRFSDETRPEDLRELSSRTVNTLSPS